ncbi:MAG: zf-HC2 domain-containing protein [Ktedonobacterales bacterium]|nr:zf-HC2 domain-containing protein [Ktedonobacterales bacterium]
MEWDTNNPHTDPERQRERLSAWLDGALGSLEGAALEQHLASCVACQREVAALRAVRALLRALPAPPLPRSFALPLEGDPPMPMGRPHSSPPVGAAPASRSASRRRWPGIAQRVGGLAATVGFALLVGNAVLGGHAGQINTAGATLPNGGRQPATPGLSSQTPIIDVPTRHPDASVTPNGNGTSVGPADGRQPLDGSPAANVPVLPLAGAGLLGGGVVLVAVGGVARRRQPAR